MNWAGDFRSERIIQGQDRGRFFCLAPVLDQGSGDGMTFCGIRRDYDRSDCF